MKELHHHHQAPQSNGTPTNKRSEIVKVDNYETKTRSMHRAVGAGEAHHTPLFKKQDNLGSFRRSPKTQSPLDPPVKVADFKKMRSYVHDSSPNPSLEQNLNFNFSQYRQPPNENQTSPDNSQRYGSKTIELAKTWKPNLQSGGQMDPYANRTPQVGIGHSQS